MLRRSALVATVVLIVAGCSGDGETADSSPVLATTSIWADVTERVACGELDVPSMIPAGTDAHSYEPSVRDADLLRGAELVVANGWGLEETLQDSLDAALEDGVAVTEAAVSVLDRDGRSPDDPDWDSRSVDPHVWTDPDRVAASVPRIAALLKGLDGVRLSDERIDACTAEYVDELHALSSEIEDLLAPIPAPRRKLVTNHETLRYFADRFGFEVVGTLVPSTSSLAESNPRDLDELEAAMREQGVDTVFAEATDSSKLADALSERLGREASVVELHTESLGDDEDGTGTYIDMMRTDARLVAEALAPRG